MLLSVYWSLRMLHWQPFCWLFARSLATKPSFLVGCVVIVSWSEISLPQWVPTLKDSVSRQLFLGSQWEFPSKGEKASWPLLRAFSLWQRLGICLSACIFLTTLMPCTLFWSFDHVHVAAQGMCKDLLGAYCLQGLRASCHLVLLGVYCLNLDSSTAYLSCSHGDSFLVLKP